MFCGSIRGAVIHLFTIFHLRHRISTVGALQTKASYAGSRDARTGITA